jgi:hypothetical protein
MPLRIVYVSTLKPDFDQSELAELVDKAAAFNRYKNITGVLAIEDNRVCQILEGPEAELSALYKRIESDTRHAGVTLLTRDVIDVVTFPDWGMARRQMADMVVSAFSL